MERVYTNKEMQRFTRISNCNPLTWPLNIAMAILINEHYVFHTFIPFWAQFANKNKAYVLQYTLTLNYVDCNDLMQLSINYISSGK